MRKGILIGGNWIIDEVKIIDRYPEEEKLVTILEEYSSNGGSAYNVLKALCKLGVDFPLEAIGRVGDDERGHRIIQDCLHHGLAISQLQKVANAHTSYTDVMTVKSTGKRTFFHHRGVNASLCEADFNFSKTACKIFHLGYLLLLDSLDVLGTDGLTGAARVLKKAKKEGLMTTIDIVSEHSDRFQTLIAPSLPFVDYLFINEYEAQKLSGMATVSPNGEILIDGCTSAATNILHKGVQKGVILHFPTGVICVTKEGKIRAQPSIRIPADKIIGTVGAGDAFAAGVLLGLHDDMEMEECLKVGVCAAAASLFNATSSEGILSSAACKQLAERYGFYAT